MKLPRTKLTVPFIRKACCCAGLRKIDFFDTRQPGLMLEVRRSGGKTFYQRYRDRYGRERQFKIGPALVITISQARKKGRQILAEALLGDDPHELRRRHRAIPTLTEFVNNSYLPFVKNTKRSWRTDETILRLHILPKFGKYPIDQISTIVVTDLLRRLRDQGYATGTTNRVLVLLRFIYNLARKWNVPGGDENPTLGLRTAPDAAHERFLSPEEARRLLAALDSDPNKIAANAIKLLLLTGARRSEITKAKWEQVDWHRKTLLVPISKTGRPRLIALSTAALELLQSIAVLPDNPFIFPSAVTGRPCPSLHFPWLRIRKKCGLLDVRLHDLRHSFASFLVNQGVPLYTVQNLLGHTQPRMTQRYAHLAGTTLFDATELISAAIGETNAASQDDRMAIKMFSGC
jgi:integrase